MTSLFQNFDLHGTKLANRIVMAPMTRSRASIDNIQTDMAATYYSQRATAGLIITEAVAVSKQGAGYMNIPGIWNSQQVAAWKKVTDAVHEKGGKIYVQLFHTGRVSHSSVIGEQPVSACSKAPEGTVMGSNYSMVEYEQPRELTESEIPAIVSQFRNAAKNAKLAGFDGIEIHAANGYLIDQFLRDGTNQRQDSYGGSLEKRMRFALEILQATTSEFGDNKVGIRFSPVSNFNSMSDSNPAEHFSKIATELNSLKLSYIHLVESDASSLHISYKMRENFKGVFISNEGITKEVAAKLLDDNKADLICIGSSFISNPDLVYRLQNNIPLAQPDKRYFYTGGEKGYIDYPAAS